MKTAYIGLGSNLGDSARVILDGWAELGRIDGITAANLSHPYRTEPMGMESDNWFINAAGELQTELNPAELLQSLHRVERQFGRRRDLAASGYQDRILDCDLLLYGDEILMSDELRIPHPRLHERLFVLRPLCEVAAGVVHPILKKSMAELLAQLQGEGKQSEVEIIQWPSIQAA